MFDKLKMLFKKGGAKLGMTTNLTRITDHEKIGVDPAEYDRIQRDLQYFEGNFPKVDYRNSNGDKKQRDYISLNMMQLVAKRMASVVFNEQAKIKVADKSTNEFVEEVLAHNDFYKNFEKNLESMFALGGLAIKPYFDESTEEIKLSWAQAPSIYPLKANTNNISEFAIASRTQKSVGQVIYYYTLLEFHEWKSAEKYTITYELYKSNIKNEVGVRVALSELYPDIDEAADLTGFSKPLVTYIKPAGFNNMNITSPIGLGICSNALNTLKQINDTYDQFHLEILMGRRRVAVTKSMLEWQIDERDKMLQSNAVFDPEEMIYQAMPGDKDNPQVTDLTSEIRTQAYQDAMNTYLTVLENQVGLSTGTFSFDSAQGIKTATEIASENSKTYQTRNSQVTQIERGIKELIVSIVELYNSNQDEKKQLKVPAFEDISVDLDDGIFVDKKAQLDYWSQRIVSGLATKADALKAIDGLSDEEAKRKAAEIDGNVIDETQPEDDEKAKVDEGGGDE